MGSSSSTTDKTETKTDTTIVDRKAVQQQGQQILDSLIVGADDKVVREALAGVAVSLEALTSGSSATIGQVKALVDQVLTFVNKGQADISAFGMQALETAQRQLLAAENQGTFVLKIADQTVDKAMTMAEQVAKDQASAQRQALEIVADAKTGDYADTLTTLSAMVMAFSLAALFIIKRK